MKTTLYGELPVAGRLAAPAHHRAWSARCHPSNGVTISNRRPRRQNDNDVRRSAVALGRQYDTVRAHKLSQGPPQVAPGVFKVESHHPTHLEDQDAPTRTGSPHTPIRR